MTRAVSSKIVRLTSEHLNQGAKKYIEATRGIHSFLLNAKVSKFFSVISFCALLITWFSKISA
jgi:hypothetical protein